MGVNFELDLRAQAFLKRYQHHVNVELGRQYDQLARSLDDLIDSVVNGSAEDEWRTSVSNFAEHWEARGLRLSERTVGAITRLIADERSPVEKIRDAVASRESESATSIIMLAAAPRRPSRAKKHPAPVRRFPPGKWVNGTEGNGLLRLAKPVTLPDGTIVREIPFRNGMPIFDKWAVRADDVFIAMTGDQGFDQRAASEAWKAKNKGASLDSKYMFHHDGQVVEAGRYGKRKIVAGRMQVIPRVLNELPHVGSASIAREFQLDEETANKVNEMALSGKGPLAGRLRKTLMRRARQVRRLIPIVGGLLTIIYFAEDVEAHGVGGALARATPVLGDILAAYDLGSELAADIRASGVEQVERAEADANDPVQQAHKAAERATAIAFNEVASQIAFQIPYSPDATDESTMDKLVDAIQEPLAEFRGEAYTAYFSQLHGRGESSADTDARLERAKGKLKRDIEFQLRLKFAPPPTSFH